MNQQDRNQSLTLARLLCDGQWATINALFALTSDSPSILIDDPSLPHPVTEDIIVHFAVRFQAPLRIVTLLSSAYADSLSNPDAAGRYPIHVAAKWGAPPDVIQFLIKSNPSVAGLPDDSGRTPMSYIGEFYHVNFSSRYYNRDEAMLEVVRLMKFAAPNSVNLEDESGMNAIEYALLSEANISVIRAMQRACRDDWRERSKAGVPLLATVEEDCDTDNTQSKPVVGRRRHQDLVKDIRIMATTMKHFNKRDRGLKLSDTGQMSLRGSGTCRRNSCVARTA